MNDDNQLLTQEPAHCGKSLCPLNRARLGMALRVKQICASPEVGQRLRELGLAEDQIVRLLCCGANVICMVCNARLALSAQLAETILVEPLPPAPAWRP